MLDRVAESGAIAPHRWPREALNGLLMAERRRRLTPAKCADLAALLHQLPLVLDRETTDRAWTATARLAERFTLSLYDATYLELAHRRQCPLATLDRPLRSAATALGLETLPA